MTKQEQINRLQFRIERIENELGLVQPDYFAMPIKSNLSEKPNSYDHLLPEGYEFCAEGEAEKLVKVEMINTPHPQMKIGTIATKEEIAILTKNFKDAYRPIRPIQYHVAVHEAVTTEPNPYAVDWSNAPDWADVHCFDKNGKGSFYGATRDFVEWYHFNLGSSGFTLPIGLDWKLSKTTRP